LGVEPPRGLLLIGAPGTVQFININKKGKTLVANAIAGELGDSVTFLKLSGPV
jgi:ATP-dependent 26S proteasome regulatory subunit